MEALLGILYTMKLVTVLLLVIYLHKLFAVVQIRVHINGSCYQLNCGGHYLKTETSGRTFLVHVNCEIVTLGICWLRLAFRQPGI